jgi:protein-S-isoprenylcysteine O-methyltransferase Ste14
MGIRVFALLRALVVSTLFLGLFVWFIPRWIAGGAFEPHWNAATIIVLAIGAAIMARCIWDFAWTGRGTPAPFDPPRRLVVAGLYRYVRNPMYVGMGVFLIGEALLLPDVTRELLLLVGAYWAALTAFIILYEEPTLRRLFGADYAEYCRHVRRWIPRLTPFDKPFGASVISPDLD